MKKLPALFLLGLLSLAASGCAPARAYQVRVNGYTEATGPLPAPGDSLLVMEDPKALNPLLEKEIKAKIDKLAVQNGFRLAPGGKAQYCLFFTYGLAAVGTVSVTGPIGPGRGWAEFGYSAYLPAAYGPYATDTLTLYDRWLRLTVVEGKHCREAGRSRPVWVGEARSVGASANLREVLNPLLIAAFEQFGKNTGQALPARIQQDDPRLGKLEKVR